MDENDGVRTRLTHSHEVANLARSIGAKVAKSTPGVFGPADLHDVVQPLLLAIGLSHDLGNPPFGHQGEAAIGRWFGTNQWVFEREAEGGEKLQVPIPPPLRIEFTEFDGNPQTLRLLTKLQTSVAHAGLDLTAATLAASLKYPVGAAGKDKAKPVRKKYGYFESERAIVNWVRSKTGLDEGQRHPLTWIMEACDDIAYSVLDVDDAMKKGVVSPDDVYAILHEPSACSPEILVRIGSAFEKVKQTKRRAEVARDIKIGYLRALLIDALVDEAASKFVSYSAGIFEYSHETPLMDESCICNTLKKIAQQYAFSNSGVLRMEALGATAISGLMEFFWRAI
jgi:dGTPase